MSRGMPTPEQRRRERDEALLRRSTMFGENAAVRARKEAAKTFAARAAVVAFLAVFWLVVGCAIYSNWSVNHVG